MITPDNVHMHSNHYKNCKNEEVREKALNLIKYDCFTYDKESKRYVCVVAMANYFIYWDPQTKGMVCNCKGTEKDLCHHILGLYLQFKIWNAEKKAVDKAMESI